MIRLINKKYTVTNIMSLLIMLVSTFIFISCEENTLPEAGSVPDLTPPVAKFSASQSSGDWQTYTFSNESVSATDFTWDFGDGQTSTDKEPINTYAAEGTYNVTLVASDKLGVKSTVSETIQVVEPLVVVIPDPVLINSDFVKTAKSSGSDCTCSGWINKSLGDQGESSSGNGSDVLKFDNNEPDHIYQEFEVTPNADYTIKIIVSFKSIDTDPSTLFPGSMLELRVLSGAGYTSGYSPTYYTETVDFPQDGYGYATIASVEDAANNLEIAVTSNPGDTGYIEYTYNFNAGNNVSAAMFMRGIGGDTTGNFGYNSGDEEIRLDSVVITAN